MAEIRHISTSIVCPSRHNNDDQSTTRRIELTPWDLTLLRYKYSQCGLLFRKPEAKEVNQQNLIQNLKASLSCTLNLFYPLAGRLSLVENKDNTTCCFYINCNGVGAHFVHAAADGVRVADILDPVYVPHDIVNNLFSMNSVRNYEGISKPVLAAQVTELIDGIFIGCTINHALMDGTSFWHFLNTWSEISRSGSAYDEVASQISPPVFGRQFLDGLPVHIPFSQIQTMEKLIQTHTPSLSFPERVFRIPKEKVAQLKAKANAEMGTNNISSLQALMAHFWRATTRARLQDLKSDEETAYLITVGLRQRLKPPLPYNYTGNALLVIQVKSTVSNLLQNGPGWAALKINQAIAAVTQEYVSKGLEHWMKTPTIVSALNFSTSVHVHTVMTTSSPRFNVYGNDFGWGRPLAMRSGAENKVKGMLTVYPGVEEGSIEFHGQGRSCVTGGPVLKNLAAFFF